MREWAESPPPEGEGNRSPQASGREVSPSDQAGTPLRHGFAAPPPLAGEELSLADLAATEAFGASLAALVRPGDVITLSGPLGAGKTSVARGLLAALGLAGEAPSPSFAIVQPYDPPEVRLPVLHVDLYRVEDARELEELGLDEADDALLLVEWPERVGAEHWPDALALTLSILPDGARGLTARVPAAWEARWPPT